MSCDITVSVGKISGPVILNPTVSENERAIIDEMDVEKSIKYMDIEGFRTEKDRKERLRDVDRLWDVIWRHMEIFKVTGCVMGYKHEL